MKKVLFLLASLCSVITVTAQSVLLWPVQGKKAGEDIEYKPQQSIGSELNFANLIISGKEGDVIVSPTDGVLKNYSITVFHTLTQAMGGMNNGNTFDEMLQKVDAQKWRSPLKYINGSVGITMSDGRTLHISGLRGDKNWKTGMKIKRGEVLGTMGYAYSRVQKPCILLSISSPNGSSSDPMSPFGLTTTFKPNKEIKAPNTLTLKQANEDFDFLLRTFKDCYPSYDNRVTPEKYDAFVKKSRAQFKEGMKYDDFYDIVRSAFTRQFINDSHLWTSTPFPASARKPFPTPALIPGCIDGKLIVVRAKNGLEKFLGKEIVSIDNRDASEIIQQIRDNCNLFDGNIESMPAFNMLVAWENAFVGQMQAQTNVYKFTDGTTYTGMWAPRSAKSWLVPTGETSNYIMQMAGPRAQDYEVKQLNDSVAMLKLSTFTYSQVELEEMAEALKKYLNIPHLIIDVRFNDGGHFEVLNELLTWFIEKPLVMPESYKVVNSNSTYDSFKHSLNYPKDATPFDYFKPEGKQFVHRNQIDTIMPSSKIRYRGKIYLLTNEHSLSAATDFPATLVHEGRAVTIGRETGTGYHYMTADKFVDFMLPNSKIRYTVPLVKLVFDDKVTDRFPAERGLMPDYEVPLTYEELYTSPNDFILDRALKLIATGK